MDVPRHQQRTIAVLAIVAGILALLSLIVGLVAVDGDFEVLSEAEAVLDAGTDAATYLRGSYLLNMFGNYLLLLPLALLLYHWLKRGAELSAQIYTVAGGIYLVLGAAGSAIFAATWPFLIEEYATADEVRRATLLADFELVTALAGEGLHGIAQNVAGAVWFIGIGNLLRARARALGVLAIVVGLFLVVTTLGNILGIEGLSIAGLTGTILLAPAWGIAVGIRILRKPHLGSAQ